MQRMLWASSFPANVAGKQVVETTSNFMKILRFQSSLVIVHLQLKKFHLKKRIQFYISHTVYIRFLNLFDKQEEAELNPFSFSIFIRARTSIGSYTLGKLIHAAVISHGFETNLPVMNSILDMYCSCGDLLEANQYFHEMNEKDLITWNTLITGYEKLDSTESLRIFSQIESEGFSPNCFTFTSVTAACANLALLNCRQQVHGGIVRRGLDGNLALANAPIDMYGKCGSISDSRKVFSEITCRDLVSRTTMMIGYGAYGYGKDAVELFGDQVWYWT